LIFVVDLRSLDNCLKVSAGCEWVFNLAADMGGMGFIQANHSVILYNNTLVSFNLVEVSLLLDRNFKTVTNVLSSRLLVETK